MGNSWKNKGRSVLYAMAGFYLVYMAYQVFKNRADSAGGEYIAVMIGAAAFLVIGAGLIGFGLFMFYKLGKGQHEAARATHSAEELPKAEEALDNSEEA